MYNNNQTTEICKDAVAFCKFQPNPCCGYINVSIFHELKKQDETKEKFIFTLDNKSESMRPQRYRMPSMD